MPGLLETLRIVCLSMAEPSLHPPTAEPAGDPFKLPRDLEPVSNARRSLAERACALRGHPAKDRRCLRIDLPHPLLNRAATIRWRLADPPPAS